MIKSSNMIRAVIVSVAGIMVSLGAISASNYSLDELTQEQPELTARNSGVVRIQYEAIASDEIEYSSNNVVQVASPVVEQVVRYTSDYYKNPVEDESGAIITYIDYNEPVTVVFSKDNRSYILYGDIEGYMNKEYLVDEEPGYDVDWEGKRLNTSNGIVQGPSGTETYYNLNMSNIVVALDKLGYDYEYWVRDDGVKMYGPYVIVAANFDTRPVGTILPTTKGLGIVGDTGSFVSYRPNGIDIAVSW